MTPVNRFAVIAGWVCVLSLFAGRDTEYRSYPPGATARVGEDQAKGTAEVLSPEAGPGGASEARAARQRRQAWWQQIPAIEPQRLVLVDESGVTTEMTRRYGRAPRGERVREATPAGHWRTLTVLGAMRCQGLLATMTVESSSDGDVFLGYLEQVLCSRLQPGQVW